MIESILINRLLHSEAIKNYCNGNMFISNAPNGTKTPYIVITANDGYETGDESNVITTYDIDINVYDYEIDIRKQREVSELIKQILHNNFDNIRCWFKSRSLISESESTMSRINMQFNARKINDVINN